LDARTVYLVLLSRPKLHVVLRADVVCVHEIKHGMNGMNDMTAIEDVLMEDKGIRLE